MKRSGNYAVRVEFDEVLRRYNLYFEDNGEFYAWVREKDWKRFKRGQKYSVAPNGQMILLEKCLTEEEIQATLQEGMGEEAA